MCVRLFLFVTTNLFLTLPPSLPPSFLHSPTFPDENFRVPHNKAGLLSMANAGPHTNGSQFFLTFKPTPHLNGLHVVFGELIHTLPPKVKKTAGKGETTERKHKKNGGKSRDFVDILARLAEVETNGSDTPFFTYKVVVTDCGVLKEGGKVGG